MDEGFCEYCSYRPCACGGRVHAKLYGKVPKYSREWYRRKYGIANEKSNKGDSVDPKGSGGSEEL
jgi:hypothetical protein